jgi:outer membrane biosynthesis protein TonB
MNTVRVERRLIGSHRTRMDVRGLLVVASMIAVFACAFAAGRATTAGPVSHVEDTSSVPAAAAAGAVIPVRLSTAPPLQLAPPPPKAKPKPPVRHSVPAVSIRPVAPPEAAHAEAAQPEPAPATPAPAQPAAPVAREPAPTPAPAPTPTPTPTPAAKQPSAPSTGAPAGGGSFESSG